MNKKHFLHSIILFTLILTATSCSPSLFGAVGRGSIVDEPIAVTPFTSVVTSASADVTITTGDSLQVILSDYENLIELWEVKVENNQLVIETKPFTSLINSKAKVTIVMPATLKEVKIAGSRKMYLADLIANDVTCIISGSGNMYVYAQNSLNATITGSGNIIYSGNPTVDVKTSGSGSVRHE